MEQHSDKFLQEQKDWPERKLSIIQHYLAAFTKFSVSTTQSCVYYIDGFAGKYVYEDGEKGSTNLAAEISQEYRDKHKNFKLSCINIEPDNEIFQNLEESIAQFQENIENLNSTFSSQVPTILQNTGDCPAFFFTDPFGISGAGWSDMVKIPHRVGLRCIWLLFDQRTVRRLSGFFVSGSRGADCKEDRLLRFNGVHSAYSLLITIRR